MDIINYYESLTLELENLKNRVRNFIEDAHWQTDGEWKESVLKNFLNRSIPDTVKIGKGFIITQQSPSTQIDILIYRNDSPIFFRDGDLVFIPPEGVLGVVEVKSNVNASSLKQALIKLIEIRKIIRPCFRREVVMGLFSYDDRINSNKIVLDILNNICSSNEETINLISLGNSRFVKWWDTNPDGSRGAYNKWHSYTLQKMAPGYFIHNIIMHLSIDRYWTNQNIWFPPQSKEFQKDGEIGIQ